MDVDRGAALGGFLRFLAGNPEGDAAARALTIGALAPLDTIAAQIYGIGRPDTLELLGSFGYPAAQAAAYRTLVTSLPLPICDAFTSATPMSHPSAELPQRYPLLATPDALADTPVDAPTRLECVPITWAGAPVGVLSVLVDADSPRDPGSVAYLEGVAAALALWMLEQRRALIDRWRRAAPLPHREFTISPRQHRVLELIAEDKTNTEIARLLDYSIPTIKKDLQEIMKLLGTQDRRSTAGRAREIGLLPDRRARDGAAR